MTLQDTLAAYRPRIVEYVEQFIRRKIDDLAISTTGHAHLYQTLLDFSTKGKLLRGCFFLFSYEMWGGTELDKVVPIAAAIEINGSALLIHDDIIDHDVTRRGGRSVYAQYVERGKEWGVSHAEDFGVGTGILVGDIAFFLVFEMLEEMDLSDEIRKQISTIFNLDMQTTALGQMMDSMLCSTKEEPSEAAILEMYRLKTATYTFVNPFGMGAYAAGTTQNNIDALKMLCEKMGVMFQIKDDEIGILGDETVTGKSVGSDIKGNKKTLIRHYLMEVLSNEERARADKIFGNEKADATDVAEIQKLIRSHGVNEKIVADLKKLADETGDMINNLPIDAGHKKVLHELVAYNISRQK